MIYDKILLLCKNNKITIKDLEQVLGFGNKSLANWKTHTPGIESVIKVANYFKVSVDYLIGRDGQLTEDEVEVLMLFRSLNTKAQETVLKFVEFIASQPEYKKCDLDGLQQEIG